jgi:hypothetical protein
MMTDENGGQNFSKISFTEEDSNPSSDINPSQEQRISVLATRPPDRPPQYLFEWLARISRRYLALDQEKYQDTS